MVESVHHIAVVVSDVEKSRRFYQEAFELPEIPRDAAPGSSAQGAWLNLGGLQLHLQWRENAPEKSDQHFAIVVNDFAATAQRAAALGGKVKDASSLSGYGRRCFVYDLDKNRIEVLEKI